MTDIEYALWVAETNLQMKRFDLKPIHPLVVKVKLFWGTTLCRLGFHKFYEDCVGERMDLISCVRCHAPVPELRKLMRSAGIDMQDFKELYKYDLS